MDLHAPPTPQKANLHWLTSDEAFAAGGTAVGCVALGSSLGNFIGPYGAVAGAVVGGVVAVALTAWEASRRRRRFQG